MGLDTKSAICNANQVDLEEKSCAHASKINEVLTEYYYDQAQATSAYNCAVEEIMELERDRKREWITLQVVNCLLSNVHDLQGRPCDTETGEVDQVVGECLPVQQPSPCTDVWDHEQYDSLLTVDGA